MRKYFLIGMGGFFGAIIRVFIGKLHIINYNGSIPVNTLIINISGSFLLACFLTLTFEVWKLNQDIRKGIAAGLFGAYTTFSTFCREVVQFFSVGDYFHAVLYMTVSTVFGLAAACLGIYLIKAFFMRQLKSEQDFSLGGIDKWSI